MKQIVVVGGGAAGLMSAWHAKTEDTKVVLLEAGEKPGKKLLATGNGRCNLTYASKEPKIAYRGAQTDFVNAVLKQFSQSDTLQFFEEQGMLLKKKGEGIYPYTEQAQTVLSVLMRAVSEKGVRLKTRERVTEISRQDDKFLVKTETWQYEADAVILACGSKAAPALGADDIGYTLAQMCGHHVLPVLPALVPLQTKEKQLHALAGLRSRAELTLLVDGKELAKDSGELQWTNYGISGIVVFQLSRFAAEFLQQGRFVRMMINLLPGHSLAWMKSFLIKQSGKRADHIFGGIFPEKLTAVLLSQCRIRPGDLLSESEIEKILRLSMGLSVEICKTRGFEYAQVCAGGVDTLEICEKTMESKLVPGLYFAGELLDVDGACGGYNLQWAWSSGAVAGKNCSKKKMGD